MYRDLLLGYTNLQGVELCKKGIKVPDGRKELVMEGLNSVTVVLQGRLLHHDCDYRRVFNPMSRSYRLAHKVSCVYISLPCLWSVSNYPIFLRTNTLSSRIYIHSPHLYRKTLQLKIPVPENSHLPQ